MFDKLESVVNRYEQVGIELTRPDVASNNEMFRKLMKEHSELTPIVEKYREYSELFESDLYDDISLKTCVEKRISAGGTGEKSIDRQIDYITEFLNEKDIH